MTRLLQRSSSAIAAKKLFRVVGNTFCTRRALFGLFWIALFLINQRFMLGNQKQNQQQQQQLQQQQHQEEQQKEDYQQERQDNISSEDVLLEVRTSSVIESTQQHQQHQQEQQQNSPQPVLPTPILVMGLPKTGTSTIHAFFERSGYRSSHYKCEKLYCGLCFQAAIKNNKPPLQSCGNYDVYAQMDIENIGQCYLPQIQEVVLEILYQEAPNATWILSTRNMTHWIKSAQNWVGASGRSLARRLAKCKAGGGPKTISTADLTEWHQAHLDRIRNFCRGHPSLNFVEIDIESPKTAELMAQYFGSTPANWGHENDSATSKASWISSKNDTTT